MASSIIPALIDALVSQATAALPSVQVFDGYGITDDPGDFLMIGVDDPDSPNSANSANAQQRAATAGTSRSRDEEGTVTCVALSWNGNANQKAARDGAFAIVAAVENFIRTATPQPYFGVTGLYKVGFGGNVDLSQDQNAGAAMALITFSVTFTARI